VPVLPALDGIGRQVAFANRASDRLPRGVQNFHGAAADLGHIAFFEEHEAARDGEQRRYVGGREIFIDP
jgi:hypothetical protein